MAEENVFKNYDSEDSVFHAPLTSDDGEIKNYDLTEGFLYPCLVLETEEAPPGYRIQVLHNTLEPLEYSHSKVLDHYYDVYLVMGGVNTVLLGMVHSDNLRAILTGEVFAPFKKYIKVSENEKVEGAMMFSLCTSPLY